MNLSEDAIIDGWRRVTDAMPFMKSEEFIRRRIQARLTCRRIWKEHNRSPKRLARLKHSITRFALGE